MNPEQSDRQPRLTLKPTERQLEAFAERRQHRNYATASVESISWALDEEQAREQRGQLRAKKLGRM